MAESMRKQGRYALSVGTVERATDTRIGDTARIHVTLLPEIGSSNPVVSKMLTFVEPFTLQEFAGLLHKLADAIEGKK